MTKWNVVYYETKDGVCEVQDFLDSRKIKDQAKALAMMGQLGVEGPQLPRPYADFLRDGIHELRLKLSGEQIRTLYFFEYQDIIVLTHSFVKNTSKVPEKEIKKAEKIRNDFLSRFPKREALNEILQAPPPRKTNEPRVRPSV